MENDNPKIDFTQTEIMAIRVIVDHEIKDFIKLGQTETELCKELVKVQNKLKDL